MRTTGEIICDIKDGKEVEYEEAKLACLVFNSLLFLSELDIKHALSDNQLVRDITKGKAEERHHTALRLTPKEYLQSNHPNIKI